MKFILIMSTMGRTEELEKFFGSLFAQDQSSVSIYLCDQNSDKRLEPVLRAWEGKLAIRVVYSDTGLSRGRNAALAAALKDIQRTGGDEIVAFPDDDCWYSPGLLAGVATKFASELDLAGLTVRSMASANRPSALSSPDHRIELNRKNLFVGSMGISYCIFLRLSVVEGVGAFDESLGVGSGSPWGSGEESDYLLRALSQGNRLQYDPSLEVFHPDKSAESTNQRFQAYARGHGRILQLNGYSWITILKDVLIAIVAFAVKSVTGRKLASPYLFRAFGYLQGYCNSAPRPVGMRSIEIARGALKRRHAP